MIVLGLDPGSSVTGYGVIKLHAGDQLEHIDHGVITLKKKLSLPEKLVELNAQLEQLLLKHKPSEVSIEKIFLGKNADSAFKLGHIRGVCMMQTKKQNAEVFEYAARRVKKVVTGFGAADKQQVRWMVLSLLKIKSAQKDDATDALAMALCHARERQAIMAIKNRQIVEY